MNYLDSISKFYNSLGLKPTQTFFIIAGVIAIAASYPSFIKHQARIEADKADLQEKTLQRRALQRQFESEREQAMIANERYKSCLPVVGETFKNGTHYFSGIQKGSVIRDRITEKPLPQGTVVCDSHGITAVIDANGQASFTAYTGDRDIIQARLKRFKGSQYSQPIIK
ncbi:MAG: hypothetical protein ACFB02_08440 [Mastigocoleus sp.]